MGTYNKGILGAFSGKVGPIVGASWRGKDVMRTAPRPSTKTPTENQLEQRLKFKTVTQFLTPLKPMIKRYFGTPTGDKSRANLAMSYHLKEAVVFNGTDCEIMYNMVQISRGELLGQQLPTVTPEAGGVLKINWADNAGQATAKTTDTLIAVVYEPTGHLSEIFFDAGIRGDKQGILTLPAYLIGTQVHCWIGFVAANEKMNSTSIYMGTVSVL